MSRGALHEIFKRLLVEYATVDGALVQFAEREKRGKSDTAIPGPEGTVLQQSKEERRGFFRKGRIGVFTENSRLRPLNRIEQTELRFDLARMRVVPPKFRRNGPMQFDQILSR